jgi:hypothetical protein
VRNLVAVCHNAIQGFLDFSLYCVPNMICPLGVESTGYFFNSTSLRIIEIVKLATGQFSEIGFESDAKGQAIGHTSP